MTRSHKEHQAEAIVIRQCPMKCPMNRLQQRQVNRSKTKSIKRFSGD